jgi:hypothetical protein
MKRKVMWLFLSCIMVLTLVAWSCGSDTTGEQEEEEEASLPSAQEIIDGVINSSGNMKSHSFDSDFSLEIPNEAGIIEMSMAMVVSGAIDRENKEMSADGTLTALMPEEEIEIGIEIYSVDDMMYFKSEMPEEEPTWEKGELSGEIWEFITGVLLPIESHLDLLELADVSVIGSEKVNGVDCYVLELTPNLDDLWETARQQTPIFELEMPTIAEQVLDEAFTNFSVKQWVAKDTYFLTKSEIEISMEMTTEVKEAIGAEGMMTMDINSSFLAYDHNEPFSIVLPPMPIDIAP